MLSYLYAGIGREAMGMPPYFLGLRFPAVGHFFGQET